MDLDLTPRANYTLSDFTKDVLIKRFPGESQRHIIYEEEDKLNFACPYCGDSASDVTKKRGNIFLKNNHFKCFNDGCLVWTPVEAFISKFAQKYSLSLPSYKEVSKVDISGLDKRAHLLLFLLKPKVRNSLLDFKDVYDAFNLKSCVNAPVDSMIYKYIESRNLRDAPGFSESLYYDSRDDKLYIFNMDYNSGKVLGLSIRMIDPDYTGPKYNIKNYSYFIKNKICSSIDKEIVTNIDIINNFYNILNINFNAPILITEGQINAMFLYNSIATTGVTKSKNILGSIISKKNARILFDNDVAGKSEAMKLIADGYSVFLWSSLITYLRKQYKYPKLINEINDVNDLYSFFIKIDKPMGISEFNELINKYFSSSNLDIFSI